MAPTPPDNHVTPRCPFMTSPKDVGPRLDRRVRILLHAQPEVAVADVTNRDDLLAEVSSRETIRDALKRYVAERTFQREYFCATT